MLRVLFILQRHLSHSKEVRKLSAMATSNPTPEVLETVTPSQINEVQTMIKSVVPPLTYDKHKGQDGRIAVIGGCKEYTGAPYFAAMSAYKIGCDLAHVFCTQGAAPVIKTYSPDLIVHPELDADEPVEAIKKWLPRMHGVVIGPGLGRYDTTMETVKELITVIKEMALPTVIDADGLFLLTQSPEIIQNFQQAILTPNIVEFKRLYRKVIGKDPSADRAVLAAAELSQALGNVTVCLKGKEDIIANGMKVIICSEKGCPRRCGGQGDILSGTMGVYNFWAHQAVQRNEKVKADTIAKAPYSQRQKTLMNVGAVALSKMLTEIGSTSCAAYAACFLTKKSAELAFKEHQRSMSTTDVLAQVHKAFGSYHETLHPNRLQKNN